ncbi:4'-phosphopantetheinyl transferase superfamily protein [Streptomyces sp. NPDC001982]|uniref:4'-phosphopantetheinyl transferase family protein n=1 Tax=unclassified Streptomyces TaxID=2593676 RepID=UPI00332B127E
MRPQRNRGPADSWLPVRREIESSGTSVVYAAVADWLPDDLARPDLVAALGRDHKRLREMTHVPNRSRFVTSRLLLKSAAAAVLGTSPDELELAYKPGGRPHLRGVDQLDVSLSHTEELLVVGLTRNGRIGVDMENADRRMVGLGTERQVCTPYELEALESVPEDRRNRELVRLWTLKEAYSKAIGQGLRFRFTEFGFTPEDQQVQMQRPDGTPGASWEWSFHSWLAEDMYTLSAAVYDPGFSGRREVAAARPLLPAVADPRRLG